MSSNESGIELRHSAMNHQYSADISQEKAPPARWPGGRWLRVRVRSDLPYGQLVPNTPSRAAKSEPPVVPSPSMSAPGPPQLANR